MPKTSVAPNVDHAEIAKFEAVASRWWDLEGEFKPLHRINPLRLGYIAERSGGLFGKSPRCRLRRRHPRREHGARRRDGHRAGHGAEPLQVAGCTPRRAVFR